MLFKRKIITLCSLLLCICIMALFSTDKAFSVFTVTKADKRPQIILDAGHGGFDGGAVAQDGTVEKDINLEICLTLSDFLKTNGYDVILTRSADTSTDDIESDKIARRKKNDLQNRLKLMKTYPDSVFVSIHLNKFTTSAANGSQVFYNGKIKDSSLLGEYIQKQIVSHLQPENTRVNKQATSGTFILYNATVPAVLVECGFLSNKAELQMLKNKDYQKKMAFCIFCGINEYFSKIKEI